MKINIKEVASDGSTSQVAEFEAHDDSHLFKCNPARRVGDVFLRRASAEDVASLRQIHQGGVFLFDVVGVITGAQAKKMGKGTSSTNAKEGKKSKAKKEKDNTSPLDVAAGGAKIFEVLSNCENDDCRCMGVACGSLRAK